MIANWFHAADYFLNVVEVAVNQLSSARVVEWVTESSWTIGGDPLVRLVLNLVSIEVSIAVLSCMLLMIFYMHLEGVFSMKTENKNGFKLM